MLDVAHDWHLARGVAGVFPARRFPNDVRFAILLPIARLTYEYVPQRTPIPQQMGIGRHRSTRRKYRNQKDYFGLHPRMDHFPVIHVDKRGHR